MRSRRKIYEITICFFPIWYCNIYLCLLIKHVHACIFSGHFLWVPHVFVRLLGRENPTAAGDTRTNLSKNLCISSFYWQIVMLSLFILICPSNFLKKQNLLGKVPVLDPYTLDFFVQCKIFPPAWYHAKRWLIALTSFLLK